MSTTDAARYRIPDEPRPSGLGKYVVDPFWPLLAQMLGGSWLALPWFLFNAHALGSPTVRRDWILAGISVAGSAILLMLIGVAASNGWLPGAGVRIAFLAVIALRMAMAYALYMGQSQTFELWEYFGGQAVNGMFGAAIGAVVAPGVLSLFSAHPSLRALLG